MRQLWLILILLFSIQLQADENNNWCVSVWYPSSEFDGLESMTAHADLIHEVNPFWYTPAPDGALIAQPEAEDAELLAAWREAGLLIVPSIYNTSPDVIGEALREVHINAIVETVVRMDYDGIDMDYESLPAETREDFSIFIEGLSEALHAEGRLLSVTVHPKTDDYGMWDGTQSQDWARLAPVSDIFRIMTYDYTSRNEPPGPISPTDWVLDVLTYAESITDLSKVRMGLPFYGYSWQRGTPPATTTAWISIQNYIENFNLEILRGDNQEAYIDFKVTGLPRQIVYFSDAEELAYKLALVHEQFPTLGGVAIWGIGGEHPDLWRVLEDYDSQCYND